MPLLPRMAVHQKQQMRSHLEAVQAIVNGLSTMDFAMLERSALQMGYSQSMAAMCQRMGQAAPGFTERAVQFHKSADQIALAARAHDGAAVQRALHTTLAHCTSCHAQYRQEVVDQATLDALIRKSPKQPDR